MNRTKLVEAARTLFTLRGHGGVSVDDIATHAGLTKGAVYYQFKDKTDLFAAACRLVVAEIISAVTDMTMDQVEHHVDELVTGSEQLFILFQRDDAHRLLLLDGPAVLGPAAWSAIVAPLRLELAQHAIQHIADAGLLVQDLVEPIADLMTAAFNETVLIVARGGVESVEAERARQAYRHLAGGLLQRR
jgi:AcrR family transcriptional regulator